MFYILMSDLNVRGPKCLALIFFVKIVSDWKTLWNTIAHFDRGAVQPFEWTSFVFFDFLSFFQFCFQVDFDCDKLTITLYYLGFECYYSMY